MLPILLRWGPITIHSYPALVNLGLLLGAALTLVSARRREMDVRPVLDASLAAAVGGVVLGRAAYVGVHSAYYVDHLGRAVQPWDGGLLWQGALLGGIVGAATMAAVRGLQLTSLLDVLTPGAACLAVFAWLACFMIGCASGVETYPGQGLLWTVSLELPDLYGIREPRVAVQLLGAGWSAVVLGATVLVQRGPSRRGAVFSLWLTLQSLGSFGLGFLRADEMPSLAGWRIDQVANLGLGGVGIALLCVWTISRSRAADR